MLYPPHCPGGAGLLRERPPPPWQPLCMDHMIWATNLKWLQNSADYEKGGADGERHMLWPREGENKSLGTNQIILTRCNTTRNILERFCCLLHSFKGKSSSGALILERTSQAFGLCEASAQLYKYTFTSLNNFNLFIFTINVDTFGIWRGSEGGQYQGFLRTVSHGSQQHWVRFLSSSIIFFLNRHPGWWEVLKKEKKRGRKFWDRTAKKMGNVSVKQR